LQIHAGNLKKREGCTFEINVELTKPENLECYRRNLGKSETGLVVSRPISPRHHDCADISIVSFHIRP
jgi:hypothetical protein